MRKPLEVTPLGRSKKITSSYKLEQIAHFGVNIMVQERNLERPKFQEQDIDQRSPRPNISPNVSRPNPSEGVGGRNLATDTATGLALLLSIVAFLFSSIAVVQAVRTHRDVEAILQAANRPIAADSASQKSIRSFALLGNLLPISQRIEPGRFVQPVYNGDGRIELLSADRVNGASDSNVVNLKMRVQRLREQLRGSDIDLAQTAAINSRTNMRYPALDFRTPNGKALSLYSLRPGESVDVMVMLRVPAELNRVDLQIPETVVFRGVPIATSASSTNAR